jgi:hypothetical protein
MAFILLAAVPALLVALSSSISHIYLPQLNIVPMTLFPSNGVNVFVVIGSECLEAKERNGENAIKIHCCRSARLGVRKGKELSQITGAKERSSVEVREWETKHQKKKNNQEGKETVISEQGARNLRAVTSCAVGR